mgnify:CR=1 FL=1
METVIDQQLPTFEKRGLTLRVNFNEEEFIQESEGQEPKTMWRYTTAAFPVTASRPERIEAIIATRYPSYGSELAAINNGGAETDAYHAFRELAKQLANDSFGDRNA